MNNVYLLIHRIRKFEIKYSILDFLDVLKILEIHRMTIYIKGTLYPCIYSPLD